MNFYEMLEHLESLSGSTDKMQYLIYILKHVKNAETFFRFAYNDDKYGIGEQTFKNAFFVDRLETYSFDHVSDFFKYQIFEPKKDGSSYKIPDLIEFGNILLNNSGNKQQTLIYNFIRQCEPLKKKWFTRAILKDLRCGIKIKTINRVFKQIGLEPIPVFAMQLCDKIDVFDENKMAKKITYPCSIECKYDGIRTQAEIWVIRMKMEAFTLVYEMGCRLTSRRGNDRTHLYPEIVETLKHKFAGETLILDGEIISSSFQDLTRKDSTSKKKYVVFDLLNDEKLPYISRWDNLLSLFINKGITDLNDNKIIKYNNSNIILAEHYSANCLQDIQDFYNDLNKRKEEGIIIKLDNKIYERGTRRNMFKCKKVYTADLECYGFKYGEGRRSNKVSTLCLKDASGTIKVDVGSGIDDFTSEELTKKVKILTEARNDFENPDFIGKIVEIAYNEITETGSIRFPRFIAIREDKDEADDLSKEDVRQGGN